MTADSKIFFAVGLGVMHAIYTDLATCSDIVPVDYVNNVIIAAGWKTAKKQDTGVNKTQIYAVASSSDNPITIKKMIHILETECLKNYPTQIMVAYPFIWVTSNPIIFWIYSWLLHLIPAHILDGISDMLGKKRRYAKQAKKMYKIGTALSYFSCNQWQFDNQNTAALFDSLSKEDKNIFNFDMKEIDWTEYFITWCIGLRKYILKDGLTGTLNGRKKQMFLGFLTLIVLPLYFYCLYRITCFAYFVLCMLYENLLI